MMKTKILLVLCYYYVVVEITAFIHPVGEEEYDVLLQLANGKFSKSVHERTRVEKSAIIRFWRSKGKFTTDGTGNVLFIIAFS